MTCLKKCLKDGKVRVNILVSCFLRIYIRLICVLIVVTQRKIANINVVSDSIPLIRTYGRIYLTNENAIIVDLAAEDLKFVVSSSAVLFVVTNILI